eukprot:tig00000383_g24673.t1
MSFSTASQLESLRGIVSVSFDSEKLTTLFIRIFERLDALEKKPGEGELLELHGKIEAERSKAEELRSFRDQAVAASEAMARRVEELAAANAALEREQRRMAEAAAKQAGDFRGALEALGAQARELERGLSGQLRELGEGKCSQAFVLSKLQEKLDRDVFASVTHTIKGLQSELGALQSLASTKADRTELELLKTRNLEALGRNEAYGAQLQELHAHAASLHAALRAAEGRLAAAEQTLAGLLAGVAAKADADATAERFAGWSGTCRAPAAAARGVAEGAQRMAEVEGKVAGGPGWAGGGAGAGELQAAVEALGREKAAGAEVERVAALAAKTAAEVDALRTSSTERGVPDPERPHAGLRELNRVKASAGQRSAAELRRELLRIRRVLAPLLDAPGLPAAMHSRCLTCDSPVSVAGLRALLRAASVPSSAPPPRGSSRRPAARRLPGAWGGPDESLVLDGVSSLSVSTGGRPPRAPAPPAPPRLAGRLPALEPPRERAPRRPSSALRAALRAGATAAATAAIL